MPTLTARSYEEACASHRWQVPERYNIAEDVCDKHPRDKLAMVWEDCRGNERRVSWGELQISRRRSRTSCVTTASSAATGGDRCAGDS